MDVQAGNGMNDKRRFGRHVRSLRRARGMTQEVLADRCGLSADTIRRLEHGGFSPSLDTLRKLCAGLDLLLSTLFDSYELGETRKAADLMDLVSVRSDTEIKLLTSLARTLFGQIDEIGKAEDDDEPDDAESHDDDD